ncbi:hypothetical protein QBC41DRAFT_341866 [Cercophora samala]|uniref:Uncharacterized protein n=1 Tax=Cercophora samala TaxID=330535 RepID=A0AA39ZNZ1_9PEZI|nr:hypothetical protein QBC41DRAFT_341866 [Cercophora samala]
MPPNPPPPPSTPTPSIITIPNPFSPIIIPHKHDPLLAIANNNNNPTTLATITARSPSLPLHNLFAPPINNNNNPDPLPHTTTINYHHHHHHHQQKQPSLTPTTITAYLPAPTTTIPPPTVNIPPPTTPPADNLQQALLLALAIFLLAVLLATLPAIHRSILTRRAAKQQTDLRQKKESEDRSRAYAAWAVQQWAAQPPGNQQDRYTEEEGREQSPQARQESFRAWLARERRAKGVAEGGGQTAVVVVAAGGGSRGENNGVGSGSGSGSAGSQESIITQPPPPYFPSETARGAVVDGDDGDDDDDDASTRAVKNGRCGWGN